jgi:hypothetical protein
VVSLQFRSSETVLLKLTHVRIGKLNKRVSNPRQMLPFPFYEEVTINEHLMNHLTTPVKFTYTNGMISNVVFDGIEEPWSANIKRGVLNMLQVNLHRRGRTDLKPSELQNLEIENEIDQIGSYSVKENTMEGECDTFYTVTSQPSRFRPESKVINVTKSINFESCSRRPEIKYNFRFQDLCPTCEDRYNSKEKILESSTVSSYNISGTLEKFMIESCKVSSEYVVVPFSKRENVISTYVKQYLRLVKTGSISTPIREPREPRTSDTDMIFTQDWDSMKERFFMEGDETFVDKTPYSSIENKVQFVTEILRKLVGYMHTSVKDEAPRHFSRLVKVLRMMKNQELDKIHQVFRTSTPEDFTREEVKRIRDLLADAMAIAGTRDCVKHLVKEIRNKEVNPIRGALAIKSLVNVRVVSKEMIMELLKLTESEVCKRSPFLKQSVWLTVGSMVNALCVPNEDKLSIEFNTKPERICPLELRREYIEKLWTKFQSAESMESKILYLKTISNMGLDVSIEYLQKIITVTKDTEFRYPLVIRIEAVQALRKLVKEMPRKVQRVLMPIFMSEYENPEMRISSFYVIMQTLPRKMVLDQIVHKLISVRSSQVRSFVYSHLMTLANSTNPCERRVADDLKLSLRLTRSIPFRNLINNSKYIQKRLYSHKYNTGLGLDFGAIVSGKTHLPEHVFYTLHSNFFGLWSKYLLTVGMKQSLKDQVLSKILSGESIVPQNPRDVHSSSLKRELKKIFQKLGIISRRSSRTPGVSSHSSETSFSQIYLRYKDQEYGFLPISPEKLEKFLSVLHGKEGFESSKFLSRFHDKEYNFHSSMGSYIHEMSRKIPTTLGIPIKMGFKIPTVSMLSGTVKTETEESVKKLVLNIKPSVSSTLISTVEAWTPIVNSGLKVLVQGKLFLPIHAESVLNKERDEGKSTLKIVIKPYPKKFELLKIKTRPVTYTRVWPKSLVRWQEPEEKTLSHEEWDRVNTFNKEFGKRSLGISFRLRGWWHRTPKRSVSGTPFFPLSGPNKLQLIVEPGYEMPETIVMKFTTTSLTEETSTRSVLDTFYENSEDREFFDVLESDSESDSEWERLPEPFKPKSYKKSSLRNSLKSYKLRRPIKRSLKMEIESVGSSLKRKCSVDMFLNCGEDRKYCKYQMHMVRTPVPESESEPWKMETEVEMLCPDTPSTLVEVFGKKVVGFVKARWGPSSEVRRNYVTLKVQGEHSRSQRKLLLRQPEYRMCLKSENRDKCRTMFSPVSQIDRVHMASNLNQYRVNIDYKLPTWMLNMTNKVYRMYKNKYFDQTDVDQYVNRVTENPTGKTRAVFTLDPKSFQYVNVTVKTPKESSRFIDIPLPFPMRPVNIRKSRSGPRRSQLMTSLPSMLTQWEVDTDSSDMPTCRVTSNRIRTFDGVNYRVPLTTCYSVLAKDCSRDEPTFAVLLKKKSMESEQKVLKILTQHHKVVIRPTDSEYLGRLSVKVNGESVDLEEDERTVIGNNKVVCRISRVGSYIKVSLPSVGIKVHFDGISTSIKMRSWYKGLQCGLCGHYDGETETEFLDPEMKDLSSDLRQFHRSYLHSEDSDGECSLNEEVLGDEENYKYDEVEYELPGSWDREYLGLGESSYETIGDLDSEDDESIETSSRLISRTPRPILRTKLIEQGHELCFSKVPVPVCPSSTFAKSYKQPKKVVYCCLPRDDVQSEIYERQVRRGKIVKEIRERTPSFTQTELIPEVCRRF